LLSASCGQEIKPQFAPLPVLKTKTFSDSRFLTIRQRSAHVLSTRKISWARLQTHVNRLRHPASELGQPVLDDDEVWRDVGGLTFEHEKSAVGGNIELTSKAPLTH
jgi:hypothetical protein